MKTHLRLGATVAVLLGTVVVSAASGVASFPFRPESRLWVEGGSTVRDWTCQAGALDGSVEAAPGAARLALEGLDQAVRRVEVQVPVAALDCRNGTMNEHLRKALRANAHPSIAYRLTGYDVVSKGSSQARVRMTGTLSMAGQERPIAMEGTAAPTDDGGIRVRGSQPIVMSEWGVTPPSLMMGTMKVRDRVTVHFDVVLRP